MTSDVGTKVKGLREAPILGRIIVSNLRRFNHPDLVTSGQGESIAWGNNTNRHFAYPQDFLPNMREAMFQGASYRIRQLDPTKKSTKVEQLTRCLYLHVLSQEYVKIRLLLIILHPCRFITDTPFTSVRVVPCNGDHSLWLPVNILET